jgi:predicted nucleic acid-binding protein
LPEAPERLVVNTGPLIALGRVDALEIIGRLPLKFLTPVQVADEIMTGIGLGYPVTIPAWVEVASLAAPLAPLSVSALDEGEAAVIQLALEAGIDRVCIDEWRGRRAAAAAGLKVTGSLGLLGRAKNIGLIPAVRPWIEKLAAAGTHYHPELLTKFLAATGE